MPGPLHVWINGGPGGYASLTHPPTFLRCKKKVKKGEKERVLKQKLLKDCHQGQNVTVQNFLIGSA